jgi:hypothetical protein
LLAKIRVTRNGKYLITGILLSNAFTARMCAIPGLTYKYGLSPKLAVFLGASHFGFTCAHVRDPRSDLEVQTDHP